jgi:hypothetical protein
VGLCGAAGAAPTTSHQASLALTAAVLSIDTGGVEGKEHLWGGGGGTQRLFACFFSVVSSNAEH